MEEKSRYSLLELGLSFFLLVSVISLLRGVLSFYGLCLVFGLVLGFCFSWFFRNKQNKILKIFPTIGTLGVFAWIIYSMLNSTFFYKDLIFICVKGLLVLELIYSMFAFTPPFLIYLQALSIVLFMSFPIFIKGNYNEIIIISIVVYFITWLALLKVKFYESFNPQSEMKTKQYYSVSVSGIFTFIILVSSWLLFVLFPLGDTGKEGILPEEGSREESGVGDEYYDLQDKLMKELTMLLPKFDSATDKYEMLYLLSMLTKEFPDTMEVDKAEQGLITLIKQPGPGLEKEEADEINTILKNYTDKKVFLNMKRNKDNVTDVLKKNPFDLKNRISILNRINKMLYNNSFEKVSQHEQDLRKRIDDSSLNTETKTNIKENAKRLKAWKAFEIYRQKMISSDKAADFSANELRKEFADLSQETKQLEKLSDYKQIDDKLKKLEEKVPDQSKNIVKEIQAVANLKLEMSLAGKNINLKGKLESVNLPKDEITDLKVIVDNITDTQDYQELSKDSEELKVKISKFQPDIAKKLEELKEAKAYSSTKELKKKEEIQGTLEELIEMLPLKEETRELLKKLSEELSKTDKIPDIENIKQAVERELAALSKEGMKKEAEKLQEAFKQKIELKMMRAMDKSQADISGELKELLETKSYSLTKEARNKIKDILKDTVLQDAQIKELLKDIEKLESAKDQEKLLLDTKKVEASVDKLQSQGFISKDGRDSLIKELEQLQGLILNLLETAENKSTKELKKKEEIQGTLEELIEMLPLKEETRELLKKLSEELSKTDNIPDIENIKQAIERELAALSKEGMKKEAEKLQEAFKQKIELKMMRTINESLYALKEDMEKLKSMDPQGSAALEEHLRKIRNSPTKQEFQRRLDNLKEYVSSKDSKAKRRTLQDQQAYRQTDPWQIYIMPMRVVIPVGTFVYLKNVAIYNKIFIKELGPELDWFSSNPAVATVEEGGVVYALSKGETKISARYRSKVVEGTEVIVVDKIAKGIDEEIKNYLKK